MTRYSAGSARRRREPAHLAPRAQRERRLDRVVRGGEERQPRDDVGTSDCASAAVDRPARRRPPESPKCACRFPPSRRRRRGRRSCRAARSTPRGPGDEALADPAAPAADGDDAADAELAVVSMPTSSYSRTSLGGGGRCIMGYSAPVPCARGGAGRRCARRARARGTASRRSRRAAREGVDDVLRRAVRGEKRTGI
jgi:hypothetical protein